MGDRVSISFRKGDQESVALFSHWDGRYFADSALIYAKQLKEERSDSQRQPIDRLQPDTVMVDFIREITKRLDRVESNLYLGKDYHDGDNSDNGHFVIDLDTLTYSNR